MQQHGRFCIQSTESSAIAYSFHRQDDSIAVTKIAIQVGFLPYLLWQS